MKKMTMLVAVVVMVMSFTSHAQPQKNYASVRYLPVTKFLDIDSTLGQWYKQYMDTTSGEPTFNDFLKVLATSDVLQQRSRKAGITHNQLYSPIVTLSEKDWKALAGMQAEEMATARLAMNELDIALAAIEATLPNTAYEEFRREVIRGAKPLTEVAKKPKGAVDTMSTIIMDTKLSDRINKSKVNAPPERKASDIVKPTADVEGGFSPW